MLNPSPYDINDLFDPTSSASLRPPTFTFPGAQNAFSDQVDPAVLTAGELQGNTTVQDGFLQSANYEPNTTGWRLSPDGADINGGLEVDSLDIPDGVTANSFHVDSMGNAWWGATTFADAIASISKAGAAIFKSYSLQSQFTSGEALTAGKLVCLKNTQATWGNQANSSTNKSTTADMSAFTYVDQANPTAAAGAGPNIVKLGTSGGSLWIYGKLDLVSSNPGLPAWNEIDTVCLRIYVTTAATGITNPVTLSRLVASFTESTVTYNTRPADDGITWATSTTASPTSNGELCASAADTTDLGYIELDITEVYRLWSQGTLTNNGFVIKGGAQASIANIGGRTQTDSSAFNQAPFVVSIITKDNPGSGTTFAASDGKVYLAKHSDYQRVKNIIGIAGDTVSGNSIVPVYTLADRTIVPSTVLSVTTGRNYYLTDDSGSISVLTNEIIETNYYDRKIGIATSAGLSIDFDKTPLLIRSLVVQASGLLPPPNARYAVIAVVWNTGGVDYSATLRLEKSFYSSDSISFRVGVTTNTITASWASGTSGLLTVVNATAAVVYWYR